MAAIYDRRPVLVRREQQVLAEHPFLRAVPRGSEPNDFGEVALAARVVVGHVVDVFVDPLSDHFAQNGEEVPGSRICW